MRITAEVLRTHVTYWPSPLLFCGLFDFFALWLASGVSSTEFQVNYDLMTFGNMLHDSSSFGKLTSLMEHAKHLSFTFTCNDLTIKASFYKMNTCVASSTLLSWKHIIS